MDLDENTQVVFRWLVVSVCTFYTDPIKNLLFFHNTM